jgi:hypothetical protein
MNTYTYYVYAYIRSKDSDTAKAGTPYYIGKGIGERAYTKHYNVTKPKDQTKIIILESDLSEIGSLAVERRLIQWWGRKDLGTGILHNRTDGGEGQSGYVQPEEHKSKISISVKNSMNNQRVKQKISDTHKGKPKSEDHKRKISESLKGKPKSEDHRIKNGLAKKGTKMSEENKAKLIESRKGLPSATAKKCTDGINIFNSISELANFHNISTSTAHYFVSSKSPKHEKYSYL